jgi:phenylalanyl-tRNA synthetase beta subunit
MHVFDADKVKGDLVVRRAQEGEEILALDTRNTSSTPDQCASSPMTRRRIHRRHHGRRTFGL